MQPVILKEYIVHSFLCKEPTYSVYSNSPECALDSALQEKFICCIEELECVIEGKNFLQLEPL